MPTANVAARYMYSKNPPMLAVQRQQPCPVTHNYSPPDGLWLLEVDTQLSSYRQPRVLALSSPTPLYLVDNRSEIGPCGPKPWRTHSEDYREGHDREQESHRCRDQHSQARAYQAISWHKH